jgi:hypothetical protein
VKRGGWSTGQKVAAWLVGGAVVVYGVHHILSLPAVEEREVFLAMRIIGIRTQRPGEATPTDPPGMTAEAGRRAMVAFYDADTVDRWIRNGFTFWATPKRAEEIERGAEEYRATHPEAAQDRARVLQHIREIQAAQGET